MKVLVLVIVAEMLLGAFAKTKNNNNNVAYARAHARRGQELGYNAVSLLRSTPRKPSINKFPKDWPAFVSQWNANDLESFINSNTKDWDDTALTQRFSKWHRGIKGLRKFKQRYDYIDDVEAAGKLEEMRGILKISLSTHVTQLFLQDGDVKRRVRLIHSKNHNSDSSD
jgi:hypothetical protein